MNNQEIFDKVYQGLKAQGFKQSLLDGPGTICMYRGEGGMKCAAGQLIPDEVYNVSMEERGIVYNIDWFKQNFSPEALDFIRELQTIHDRSVTPETMKENLIEISRDAQVEVHD